MTESGEYRQPTRKEREFSRHHRDILSAAVSLFAENGYYQTTMQMIADRAEFSVGYLYKHFAGKEEMYRELLVFHLDRLDQLILETESLGLPPLEEIHRIYTLICGHFNRHRDFMRIFHQEIGGEFEEIARSKGRHFRDIVTRLQKAQATGELTAFDPYLLGAAIQGATKELFGEMANRPGDNPFDSLPDVIFRLLIDPLRK
ncbi:MAG: TetR/AcrR family transcriptional regulator [Candidatus Krumholzibacteriia bacterium]